MMFSENFIAINLDSNIYKETHTIELAICKQLANSDKCWVGGELIQLFAFLKKIHNLFHQHSDKTGCV